MFAENNLKNITLFSIMENLSKTFRKWLDFYPDPITFAILTIITILLGVWLIQTASKTIAVFYLTSIGVIIAASVILYLKLDSIFKEN